MQDNLSLSSSKESYCVCPSLLHNIGLLIYHGKGNMIQRVNVNILSSIVGICDIIHRVSILSSILEISHIFNTQSKHILTIHSSSCYSSLFIISQFYLWVTSQKKASRCSRH